MAETGSEGKDKLKKDIQVLIAHLESRSVTTLKEVVAKEVVAQVNQEVQLPDDSSK